MPRLLESLLVLIPGIALLFYHQGTFWSAYWYTPWSLVIAVFSLLAAWGIARKTTLWLFPIFATMLLSAAYVWAWSFNGYWEYGGLQVFLSLGKNAAYASLVSLIVGLLWANLPARFIPVVRLYLLLTFWIVVTVTLKQALQGETPYRMIGVLGNASMNASYIAALIPFVWAASSRRWALVATGLTLFCAYRTETVIPYGVLGVALGAYCLRKEEDFPFHLALIAIIAVLGLGYFTHPATTHGFFDTHGRREGWSIAARWLSQQHRWLFGAGLGTTGVLIPFAQVKDYGQQSNFYLWLHSDWFQMLFETGIVGFIATGVAWLWFAVRAWGISAALFSSLMAFSGMALFNYPARLAPSWLAGVFLGYLILRSRSTNQEASLHHPGS